MSSYSLAPMYLGGCWGCDSLAAVEMVPTGRNKMSTVYALDVHNRPFTDRAGIVYATRCGSSMTLRRARVLEVWYESLPDGRLRREAKLRIEITGSADVEEIGKVRTITNANVLLVT